MHFGNVKRMELDLKRLHQVLTVARLGSFSRAAEELHITQPALSRSIALLEERYGVRIFERGRGGATLTEVGKLAVAEAEGLLRDARSLEHNFRLYGRGEGGKLAFGMGPLIASMVLPGLSTHFINTRPTLRLRAVVQSAYGLYEELMGDNIEVLFCAGGQLAGEKDVVFEDMGRITRSMIVRSGHPLAAKKRISLDDILPYPFLSGVDMPRGGGPEQGGSFICDNYHILRETVLMTDAVWMTSSMFVEDALREGKVKVLDIIDDDLEAQPMICMVSRAGNLLSPAAIAVRDFVRGSLMAE